MSLRIKAHMFNDHDTLNLTIGNEVSIEISSTEYFGLIIDEHLTGTLNFQIKM